MKRSIPLLIFVFIISACKVNIPVSEKGPATRFEGIFPDRVARSKFEAVSSSVLKLTAFVNYQILIFEPDSLVTIQEFNGGVGLDAIRARMVRNESFSSTATVIGVSGNKALLLSCAHGVSFPDTLFTFDGKTDAKGVRPLLWLSLKTGQLLQVNGPVSYSQIKVLATDKENDLALLQTETLQGTSLPPTFQLELVMVSELHWGDLLWLPGYPSGRFMMTSGLLSIPDNNEGVLLTDAPFSEGYSGAPALVYDRLKSEFLLAGIGRSVAARSEYILKPEKKIHETVYNTTLPYQGSTYVEIEKQVVPGVTFITSANRIASFLKTNEDLLKANGWPDILTPVKEIK